jgi:hypothetical protein
MEEKKGWTDGTDGCLGNRGSKARGQGGRQTRAKEPLGSNAAPGLASAASIPKYTYEFSSSMYPASSHTAQPMHRQRCQRMKKTHEESA